MSLRLQVHRILVLALSLVVVTAFAARRPSGADGKELLEAVQAEELSRVKALLEAGAEVNAKNRYGATALTFATERKNLEMVRLLLEKGADPNARDTFYHQTPLSWSLENETHEISILLLENGADEVAMALLYGVRGQHLPLVKAALARGEVYDFHIEAALQIAESEDATQLVELLKDAPRKKPEFIELGPERLSELGGEYTTASATDMNLFVSWPLPRGEGLGLMQHVIMGEIRGEIQAGSQTLELTPSEGGLSVRSGQGPEFLVKPISPSEFRGVPDRSIGITFFGRTGLTEGMVLSRGGNPAIFSRRNEEEAAPMSPPPLEKTEADVLPDSGDSALNWPSFRGPNASGIGLGQEIPTQWDVETKQNIKWAVEIPGLAHSSPVVWGDRVFVTTAVGETEEPFLSTGFYGSFDSVDESRPHAWKLLSLEKSSGRIVWERTAGEAIPLSQRHSKATQANSTPVTDGRRVVAVFPTVGMVCYDFEGRQLWKQELGALDSGWFYDPSYEWGFASSPIIYKDQVILQVDIRDEPYLAAWDLDSGRQLWRIERDEIPTWSTPAIFYGDGRDVLITNGTSIRGYDPRSGQELWSLSPNSEIVIATPVAGDELVYVTGGYPPTRAVYAIRPQGRGDFSLPPGQSSSRHVAWSTRRTGSYITTPLLYRGLLYLVHHNGRLTTFKADTGEIVYRARVGMHGTFTGSPVAAQGKLYLVTEEGAVYVVKAGPDYQQLAANEMGEALLTTPAISADTLFIRGRHRLFAIGQASRPGS